MFPKDPYWKVTLFWAEYGGVAKRDIYFWCHAKTPAGAVVQALTKWGRQNDSLRDELRAGLFEVIVALETRK